MDQMNELFGSAVFEDSVQKVRLPDGIFTNSLGRPKRRARLLRVRLLMLLPTQ